MAQRVQVECIRKRDRQNAHERIEGIGGRNAPGDADPRWYMIENAAIAAIKAGRYDFYVRVNGVSVDVIVSSYNGREYLKTKADGYVPDNLLSLPECP